LGGTRHGEHLVRAWHPMTTPDPAPGPTRASLVAALRAAGCVFAEEEAALLLAESGDDDARLARLVARRVAGEPLEHVLGWAELDGVRIAVAPGVFVPRRRTVVVVRAAVSAVRAVHARADARTGPPVVVDLCCGAGAIGAAVRAAVGTPVELHAV